MSLSATSHILHGNNVRLLNSASARLALHYYLLVVIASRAGYAMHSADLRCERQLPSPIARECAEIDYAVARLALDAFCCWRDYGGHGVDFEEDV